MTSIEELRGAHDRMHPLWFAILFRHQVEGEWIEGDELAAAVRADPNIPTELADFVAGRIEGAIRRPRGRPADRDTRKDIRRGVRGFDHEIQVALREAGFRLQDLPMPRERAIHAEAEALHISSDTLKNRLRDHRQASRERPRLAPRDAPQVRQADLTGFVEQAISSGLARLDPQQGVVWLDGMGGPLENPE